jgi:hypothetical protein
MLATKTDKRSIDCFFFFFLFPIAVFSSPHPPFSFSQKNRGQNTHRRQKECGRKTRTAPFAP